MKGKHRATRRMHSHPHRVPLLEAGPDYRTHLRGLERRRGRLAGLATALLAMVSLLLLLYALG